MTIGAPCTDDRCNLTIPGDPGRDPIVRAKRQREPAKKKGPDGERREGLFPCLAFLTARGAPPPLALARRLRASLGPQALSLVPFVHCPPLPRPRPPRSS